MPAQVGSELHADVCLQCLQSVHHRGPSSGGHALPTAEHSPRPCPALLQRRWLNDKLLRDMAGALTAADMASLFKPVPFGQPRTSVWERAAQPEHAYLWDMFRSLEMDKQARVLQVGRVRGQGRVWGGAGWCAMPRAS